MAVVFVSYAHEDGKCVQSITRRIEEAGHTVEIDKTFLDPGMQLAGEMQKKIRQARFVLVFLSPHSVSSEWVSREMYEVLGIELEEKTLQLIPCVLSECAMPEAFTRLRQFERLHIDFARDWDAAIAELLQRLRTRRSSVFKDENHLSLNIPVPGLEIYMTGEFCGWKRNTQCRYVETLRSYLLFGFPKEPGAFFKHFVICEEVDAQRIRDQLTCAGYIVTGVGDKDPESNKRRVWFTVKDLPIEGQQLNNRWPLQTE